MGKPAVRIALSAEERAALEGLAGRRRTAQALALRARIVLAAADGLENKEICRLLDGVVGSVRGSGGNSELLRVWAEVAIGSAG